MSLPHHEADGSSELFKRFSEQRMLQDKAPRTWPDGRMSGADDGDITFCIGNTDGRVIVEFAKPVLTVGMTPRDAITFAQFLIKQARAATTETLRIVLE